MTFLSLLNRIGLTQYEYQCLNGTGLVMNEQIAAAAEKTDAANKIKSGFFRNFLFACLPSSLLRLLQRPPLSERQALTRPRTAPLRLPTKNWQPSSIHEKARLNGIWNLSSKIWPPSPVTRSYSKRWRPFPQAGSNSQQTQPGPGVRSRFGI